MSICSLCSGSVREDVGGFRAHYSAVHLRYFPFACFLCDCWFVSRDKLQKHYNVAHPADTLIKVNFDPDDAMEEALNQAEIANATIQSSTNNSNVDKKLTRLPTDRVKSDITKTEMAANASDLLQSESDIIDTKNVTIQSSLNNNNVDKKPTGLLSGRLETHITSDEMAAISPNLLPSESESTSITVLQPPKSPTIDTNLSDDLTSELEQPETADEATDNVLCEEEDDDDDIVSPLLCDWEGCTKMFRGRNWDRKLKLKRHWESKHLGIKHVKRFRCTNCLLCCTTRSNLRRHMEFAHQLLVSTADILPKPQTKTKDSNAKTRAKAAAPSKRSQAICDCPNCVAKPNYGRLTRRKKKRFHPETYKKNRAPLVHICRECGKTSNSPTHIKAHLQGVHYKQRPFTCEQTGCGKKFAKQQSLNGHVNTKHNGLKAFVCAECGIAFSYKQRLFDHKCIPL